MALRQTEEFLERTVFLSRMHCGLHGCRMAAKKLSLTRRKEMMMRGQRIAEVYGDGAQKVGAGLTTISEVLRVSPASEA